MTYVDIDPGAIETRDLWIPMPDGVRLHARAWLPRGADSAPVPALLEYLPYRLDDWTSVRDSERHPFYAANGYASVRVDIRGTGSSDGLFDDEYSPAELDDGIRVIEWLAAQPWCDGAVGMFGISWGGFNSLQLAARGPEALKAIVTVCSTDDRYDNDVHYMGGAVLAIDMAAWAGTMLAFSSRPPRPEVVGDGWVEQWRERLEHQTAPAETWVAHQERDAYWRHGSACEAYDGFRAAVLAVGGWNDPYRDTVFRLLDNLDVPTKGIIGPWSHQYPDRGLAPGPGIDFLGETLRWWDRWLKGRDTGAESDPDLRAWVNDPVAPSTFVEEEPGRWIGVDRSAEHRSLALPLGSGRRIVDSPWSTGQDAGRFFPFGNVGDLAPDQRAEDGRSACVDVPVAEAIEVLGRAEVRLRLRSTSERANVIVRLCDVAPDGSSTLVTRGVLNLLSREGCERSVPMLPGEDVDVSFALVACGYRFEPGHTLRIAISNHYWPWIWPHGNDGSLDIDLSASSVALPLVPAETREASFGAARHVRPIEISVPEGAAAPRPPRIVSYDLAREETVLDIDPNYGGTRHYPDGLDFLESAREIYRIAEGRPDSPETESIWSIRMSNDGWAADLETRSVIRCDAESFFLENSVTAHAERAGVREKVFERTVRKTVPRTSA